MKFTGKVIKGDGFGRKIGFPTINLEKIVGFDFMSDLLESSYGVYKCMVKIKSQAKALFAMPSKMHGTADCLMAVMNYGPRPTFNKNHASVEIHIIDFSGELYGQIVEVEVLEKIRDIKKFETVDELARAIGEDVRYVKGA